MILITRIEEGDLSPKSLQSLLLTNLNNSSISNIVLFTNGKVDIKNNKITIFGEYLSESSCVEKAKKLFPNQLYLWSDWNLVFTERLSIYNDPSIGEVLVGPGFTLFSAGHFVKRNSDLTHCLEGKKVDISHKNLAIVRSEKSRIKVEKHTEPEVIRKKGQKITDMPVIRNIKKIDAVIVSVDYNDFLILTLKNNLKYLDNITVVTSSQDTMCQEICKKLSVRCIVTDKMYENGDSFNKGKAINEGIKSIDNPDWILILDADIILTENINRDELEINTIYTSDRWICLDYERYKLWDNGSIDLKNIGTYEVDRGYGFFQLFNWNGNGVNKNYPYSEKYSNAAVSDTDFFAGFKRKESFTSCIHLGSTYKNWKGRKTDRFLDESEFKVQVKINYQNPKKLNLNDQIKFKGHRSGWEFALKSIQSLHKNNGIKFDGFIEDKFSWKYNSVIGESGIQPLEKLGVLPYKDEWVGFIHNPQNMPKWFDYNNSPQEILNRRLFKESLKNCIGLWALSEYQANWLRKELKIPISVVYHPTETNVQQFNFKKFLNNSDKKIYQIGWWLRKVNSIYQLPIDNYYRKIRLDPKTDGYDIQSLYDREKKINNIIKEEKYFNNTYLEKHLSNDEYDQIFTENIVFVDLYDSSANNAVIESLARSTPLLINPLPSVVEYLGKDYPFYFNTLEEAAIKVKDLNLIFETHEYMNNLPMKKMITGDYFCESIKNSEVYKII